MYVHRSGHALFPLITPRAQNHLLSYIISRESSSRCAIFTFLPWILPPRKHPPSTANDRNFVNISSITIQNDTKRPLPIHTCIRFLNAREDIDKDRDRRREVSGVGDRMRMRGGGGVPRRGRKSQFMRVWRA